jgi:tripartite-type tricarboxylate transporter receptor subunit TctC
MTRIARIAVPAALALAAFGAQAEGYSPSAGGEFRGAPVVSSVSSPVSGYDASIAAQNIPSAGGQFRGATVQASTPGDTMTSDSGRAADVRTSSAQQRATTFMGA